MKKIIIACCLLVICFRYSYSQQELWKKINVSFKGEAISITSNSEGTIFVGTKNNGIYMSSDSGENWNFVGPHDYQGFYQIAINRNNDDLYAIGQGTRSIYFSTNSGSTWYSFPKFSAYFPVCSDSKGSMFFGQAGGILRKAYNRERLTRVLTVFHKITSLYSNQKNNIFAGSEEGGFYFSTDGGDIWTQTSINVKMRNLIAMSDNEIFISGLDGGMYISKDFGKTWEPKGLFDHQCYGITTNEKDIILVGTSSGCLVSMDRGKNWINTMKNGFIAREFTVIPTGYIFAISPDGVFRSKYPLNNFLGKKENLNKNKKQK